MPSLIQIPSEHLRTVQGILRSHIPDRDVRAFGSRVTGKAKPMSDLDLCVMGDTTVDPASMRKLRTAFEESELPFKVDVVEWAGISKTFQRIVERQTVALLQGEGGQREITKPGDRQRGKI